LLHTITITTAAVHHLTHDVPPPLHSKTPKSPQSSTKYALKQTAEQHQIHKKYIKYMLHGVAQTLLLHHANTHQNQTDKHMQLLAISITSRIDHHHPILQSMNTTW
jgi:hypothetical protein